MEREIQEELTGRFVRPEGAGNAPEEAALAGRLFARRMTEVLRAQSK